MNLVLSMALISKTLLGQLNTFLKTNIIYHIAKYSLSMHNPIIFKDIFYINFNLFVSEEMFTKNLINSGIYSSLFRLKLNYIEN